jgi:hypothetical protein
LRAAEPILVVAQPHCVENLLKNGAFPVEQKTVKFFFAEIT